MSDMATNIVASSSSVSSSIFLDIFVDDTQTTTTTFTYIFSRTASSFISLGLSYFAFVDNTYIHLQFTYVDVSSINTFANSAQFAT